MDWYKRVQLRLPFFSDCVGWPREYEQALSYMVDYGDNLAGGDLKDGIVEFCRRTGLNISIPNNPDEYEEHEETMTQDEWNYANLFFVFDKINWGIGFFEVPGFDIIFFTWSGIEFVFATEESIVALNQKALDEDY